MQTAEISRRYLAYFAERGHHVVPSASLVSDDPTVMFTIAGMVPFVPYLTGVVPPPWPRAVDVQKCIRTNDIEEVGKTVRHGTFFQMLGNWSFGDYFKAGAIEYAWDFLTKASADGGLGFAERDLWVTVFESDDEAIALWQRVAGLPSERIQRMGRADNYWHTGRPGPGGPCSEIYVDRGVAFGPDGGPAVDDTRYTEIWNLVFMQELLSRVGSKTDFDVAAPLPNQNIDTGMGLERVAFLTQGVGSMYEIDQVRPVLDRAAALAGRSYGADHADDVRLRVVADHVRSGLMLMTDGVTPSNEGRGYILRRLLRRTIRAMRLLGVDAPTFADLFAASRDAMSDAYPEIAGHYPATEQLALGEEETFLRTLATGTTILDVAVQQTRTAGEGQLRGDTAFLLHDTYGFPIELTLEMADEAGLTVDRAAFDQLMSEQRQRAKADASAKKHALADLSVYRALRAAGETVFTGYHELHASGLVLGILRDGHKVTVARAGETVEVVLDVTALYAESGGQAPDRGRIVGDGFMLDVLDVQRPVAGLTSHTVTVVSGEVAVGAAATSEVDATYRQGANQAHSATHLVHAVLRAALGPQAHQAGSFNRSGYLRLDYTWNQSLSQETRSELEDQTNAAIRANHAVITREMPLAEAKTLGAMALFGEKYSDTVRMVEIDGPWSRELCGGTHVARSAEIGLVSIIGESSVGASSRRIESLVGVDAFRQFAAERALVQELSRSLHTPPDGVLDRVGELVAGLRTAQKRIQELEVRALTARVPQLAATVRPVGAVQFVAESVGAVGSSDDLRTLAMGVRRTLDPAASVVLLAGELGGKPLAVVATSEAARRAGADAGALVRVAAAVLGGRGGGKPDIAQAGGTNLADIPQALAAVARELAS